MTPIEAPPKPDRERVERAIAEDREKIKEAAERREELRRAQLRAEYALRRARRALRRIAMQRS
jgi:hypothetical protein